MNYFQTLPSIVNIDSNNNLYSLRNLMARAAVVSELSKNPMLLYQYTVQDGETPESVAHTYYGDQYLYWLILMANNIQDVQYDWPLSTKQFEAYILDKYAQAAANDLQIDVSQVTNTLILSYVNSAIQRYEQTTITTESETLTKAQKTIEIDEDVYMLLQEGIETFVFPEGNSVVREVTKRAVTFYEYEFEANEQKRQINLVKDIYALDMQTAFQQLMMG